MLLKASRHVINACALWSNYCFLADPLINKAAHCSRIICFNYEDSFIAGASSQVSCWQCISGTFFTPAGVLWIVSYSM